MEVAKVPAPPTVQAKPVVMTDVVVHVGRVVADSIASPVSAKQLAHPTVQAKLVGIMDVADFVVPVKADILVQITPVLRILPQF